MTKDRNDALSGSAVRQTARGMFCALMLVILLFVSAPPSVYSQNDTEVTEVAFDQAELDTLMGLVRNTGLDVSSRRDVARVILKRGWTQGFESLAAELKPAAEPTTVAAIAQALSSVDITPPENFAKSLFDLLEKVDVRILEDLTKALGRYQTPQLRADLTAIAMDEQMDQQLRIGAIMTLGHHRNKKVMQTLVKLISQTDPLPPADVRSAGFTALSHLTGIRDFGNDIDEWVRFEHKLRRLSDDEWQRQLMNNLQSRVRDLERRLADTEQSLKAKIATLEHHLTDAYQGIYQTTAAEQQPEMLRSWLTGDQPSLRELALKLIKRQLTESIKPTFPEPLRAAIRAVLDDQESQLLLEVVEVLTLLRDQSAAEVVAKRLALGQERRVAVIRQYLLMMRVVPQSAAVEPALVYLADKTLQADAAAVLSSASDQQPSLLTGTQVEQTLTRLRGQLDALPDDSAVPSSFVGLLGRLSSKDDDWDRLLLWMDSKAETVREEAARAWARSDRSIAKLAPHSADQVIQPILIAAAERRGDKLETAKALIGLQLVDEQLSESWKRALEAMSERLLPEDVLSVIGDKQSEPALYERMLNKAIANVKKVLNPDTMSSPPVLRQLILARGQMRLLSGDPEAAFSDYERLSNEKELPTEIKQQVVFGLFQAHLALSRVDMAVVEAKALLAMINPSATEPLATKKRISESFFASAERSLKAEQYTRARMLVDTLAKLLNPSVPEQIDDQIAAYRRKITQAASQKTNAGPSE